MQNLVALFLFWLVPCLAMVDFSFRGNFSSPFLQIEDTEVYADKLVLLANSSTSCQVVYLTPVANNALLSFNSTFVFQPLVSGSLMGFVLTGTSYSFPACDVSLNAVANGLYTCHFVLVLFDTVQDEAFVSVDENVLVSSSLDPDLSLKKNTTLQAWMDYRTGVIRVWIARNGTSRPEKPFMEHRASLEGSAYFFTGITVGLKVSDPGRNASSSMAIYAWSFSSSGLARSQESFSARTTGIIVASVSVAAACILGGGAWFVLYCTARSRKLAASKRRQQALSHALVYYSFSELQTATSNFREVIGKGGTCTVYKGILENGDEVAVKDLIESAEERFFEELDVISRVRHQHLVALRGWCQEHKLLLVYEYMPNGSLDKVLFTSTSSQSSPLPWKQRYKIIRSVAEALAYLHEGLESRIVHRDIKAANVLLDVKMTAKLGDFGLARLLRHTNGEQTMTKAGTMGYISPELAYTGRATEKSDVYSFGILILEIVAGRRAVELRYSPVDDNRVVLVEWAWMLHQNNELATAVDREMKDPDMQEAMVALKLALLCCSIDANDRPTTKRCCQILDGQSQLPPVPKRKPITCVYSDDLSAASDSCSTSSEVLFEFSQSVSI